MPGPARAAVTVTIALSVAAAGIAGATGGARHQTRWSISRLPVVGAGTSFSEPGVAAGPRGVLVANACTANSGSASTFWLSHDSGRTWSHGFPIGTSAIGCGDSDAVVGSDGYLYALTLGAGVDVYRSRDGTGWHGPATFPPPHGADQPDRPWLVVVPHHPRRVLMFNSEGGGNIVEWRSTDHAATFTGPVPVTGGGNSEAALALASRPLVDPKDPRRIFVYYETVSAAGLNQEAVQPNSAQFPFGQLWQASSTDGGRSWSNTMVLDVTTAFGVSAGTIGHLLPATTIDRDGMRYIVLSVRRGSAPETHLFLVHSTEHGWTTPVRLDSGSPSNVFPAIAVASPGHLFVSWYASAARDFDDASARWFEHVTTTTDGRVAHPRFRQELLGDRPVHIGAIDNRGAVGNDVRENWAMRDFQTVAVDHHGHPHVTWASDYHGTATYAATVRW